MSPIIQIPVAGWKAELTKLEGQCHDRFGVPSSVPRLLAPRVGSLKLDPGRDSSRSKSDRKAKTKPMNKNNQPNNNKCQK